MAIKGKLVIIGGAEDKGDRSTTKINNFYENGILKRILDEARLQEKSRIEILPLECLKSPVTTILKLLVN
jgi:cyanophycinase